MGKLNLTKISNNLKLNNELKQTNKTNEGVPNTLFYFISSEDESHSDETDDEYLSRTNKTLQCYDVDGETNLMQRMGGLGITSQVDFKEKIKTVENLLQVKKISCMCVVFN